ncbi:MarR family winged helix-turn-helix transcriptional regulator [Shewanella dokdonensis]|nr:MarR family transcriptional regulator [Shewanella dokdonensis]MCL1074619.1 MarR family transcriptional regulator [Shewanella dokdonensis]
MSEPLPENPLCLENQLCFSLYSAANAMVRAYRPYLEQLQLTYPQYLAMMVLWQQNGISVKLLGEQLHLDSGTLTPLLKRLEAKGLVCRGRSQQDERMRVLELTADGLALRESAMSIPRQMFCRTGLAPAQLTELKQLCDQLWSQLVE